MIKIVLIVASILLLLLLFFAIRIVYRNEKVYNFCSYVNYLVYINNILNVYKNVGKEYTYDDLMPTYNKMCYGIKSLWKYFTPPEGFVGYLEPISESDLNILMSIDMRNSSRVLMNKALRKVQEYPKNTGRIKK